jgi:MtN3 and saliva related transmembrane protein
LYLIQLSDDRVVTEWLGFLAGTLTTLAFFPQTLHSLKTRSVNDFSLAMLVSFNIGIVLWLVYGLMIGALPIVVANAVTFACSLTLLVLKVKSAR